MKTIYIQYYNTKIGELILGTFNDHLCLLDFRYRRMRATVDSRLKKFYDAEYVEKDNELLQTTRKQIDEYLAGDRNEFDIPIMTAGTSFQKEVWTALKM